MDNQLANIDGETLEAMVGGDFGKLTPKQRAVFYVAAADSIEVNWKLKPFDWIKNKDGKVQLYPNASCAAQLATKHGIGVEPIAREEKDGIIEVRVKATNREGRSVWDLGAVSCLGMKGQDLANARMKAETVAYRRAVFKLAGLGLTDSGSMLGVKGFGPAQLPEGSALVDPVSGEVLDEANFPSSPAPDLHPQPPTQG